MQRQFSVKTNTSVPAAEGAEAQHLSVLLPCFFTASISLQVEPHPEGAGKEHAAAMERCAEWAPSHQAGLGAALCHAKHLPADAWWWGLVPPSLRASQLLSASLWRSYFAYPFRYLDKSHLDLLSTHLVCSAAAGHGLLGAGGGRWRLSLCLALWQCPGSCPLWPLLPAEELFQVELQEPRALSLVCSCSAACVASSNFLLESASRRPGGDGFIWLLPLPRH